MSFEYSYQHQRLAVLRVTFRNATDLFLKCVEFFLARVLLTNQFVATLGSVFI